MNASNRQFIVPALTRAAAAAAIACLPALPASAVAGGQVFVQYFDKPTSVGLATNIGGSFYDHATDTFWTAGFVGADQAIRSVNVTAGNSRTLVFNGSIWDPQISTQGNLHVSETPWNLFARSTSLDNNGGNGTTDPTNRFQPVPGNIRLNPVELTIAGITYQPGTVGIFTDGMRITDINRDVLNDASKTVYAYDLRPLDLPGGPGTNTGRDRNGNGLVDWNDVFDTIVTRGDFQDEIGNTEDSPTFNMARDFAFSSDGKSIYMMDTGNDFAGLWQIELEKTGTDAITFIATMQPPVSPDPNSEPAVIHTSILDLDPTDPTTGDQIIIEGVPQTGNASGSTSRGIDYFIPDGTPNPTIKTLVSEADLQAFLQHDRSGATAITTDGNGNIYFYEDQTDGLYKRDAQGRLVKIASELHHNLFQEAFAPDNPNDNFLDLRTLRVMVDFNGLAFEVTEILFSDSAFDAPIGVLDFGLDFNRDGMFDQLDVDLFNQALALGLDAPPLSDPDLLQYLIFDLNGNDVVDEHDQQILAAFLPQQDAAPAVPEPATAGLAALATLALLTRRRKPLVA